MAEVRLIDANALQKKLEKWLIEMREDSDNGYYNGYYTEGEIEAIKCCLAEIESAPTVKAERHGQWINDELNGKYIYTCCNEGTFRGFGMFDFCPRCGAKNEYCKP